MKILVTGSSGFIGVQMCRSLLDMGHAVIGIDRCDTHELLVEKANYMHIMMDLREGPTMIATKIIAKCVPDNSCSHTYPEVVIHLAASISIEESERCPYQYYENNLFTTINLLEALNILHIKKVIFSSTVAVYSPSDIPLTEFSDASPMSVYGSSKLMCENVIRDCVRTMGIGAIIFRFFNVAGAPEYGHMQTHLITIVMDQIMKGQDVTIFGDDYETKDGTCVRDYIHVNDLIDATIMGFDWLNNNEGKYVVLNLGTSNGYTVREVIDEAVSVIGLQRPNIKVGPKRHGDVVSVVADSTKALSVLGWAPKHNLRSMIADSIR